MKIFKQDFQKGFLLVELMLFLALAVILMSFIFPAIFNNQFLIIDTKIKSEALQKVKNNILKAEAVGFGYLLEPDVVETGITLHQNQIWLSDYAKNFNAQASYNIFGQTKVINQDSLLLDEQNLFGRDTCNLYFSGNWESPNLVGSINLSLNNPGTDIEVNHRIAFISTNSSTQSAEDLWVYEINNLNEPFLKAKLNTGPGLSAIKLVKNYIFAANDGALDQFHIINLSNLNNIGPVIKIKVPNFNTLVSDGRGVSIFYYQDKIFLGLTKNNGPEFHVYNISNPQFPYWLGAFETNTAVNGIYVFNNIAYLALAEGKLLSMLDVSNPSNIVELGSYSPNGSTSQSGQSVVGLGDSIFLGRAGGLPQLGYKELFLLNKNNINLPEAEVDLNASVRKMFVRNELLFLATNEENNEFQILSFKNNQPSFLSGIDLTAGATSLDCEGENVFVVQEDGKVQIISPGN